MINSNQTLLNSDQIFQNKFFRIIHIKDFDYKFLVNWEYYFRNIYDDRNKNIILIIYVFY